jgi:hypothetical protein
MSAPAPATATVAAIRFPFCIWLISLAGWMFDFYDLVLFSFLLVPIGRELALTPGQEATLLGVALGGSGIGGIIFGRKLPLSIDSRWETASGLRPQENRQRRPASERWRSAASAPATSDDTACGRRAGHGAIGFQVRRKGSCGSV